MRAALVNKCDATNGCVVVCAVTRTVVVLTVRWYILAEPTLVEALLDESAQASVSSPPRTLDRSGCVLLTSLSVSTRQSHTNDDESLRELPELDSSYGDGLASGYRLL